MTAETLPQLLLERAQQYGDRKIALREKEYGIWRSVTWAGYLRHVQYFCLGLISMGFGGGEDTVAIIGDNRPEWVYAELAAQAARGKSIGIYQDSIVAEVAISSPTAIASSWWWRIRNRWTSCWRYGSSWRGWKR